MVPRIRRPSPAMVVACIALAVALGGTGYAAVKLPPNSVTTREVKDGSLLAKDFKAGQLPRGPAGPKGEPGASSGPTIWAVIDSGGTVVRGKGIVSVTKPTLNEGLYNIVTSQDVTGCDALVSIGAPGAATVDTGAMGGIGVSGLPGSANGIYVETRELNGRLTNKPFHLVVFC